jgi:peroxiredoxin
MSKFRYLVLSISLLFTLALQASVENGKMAPNFQLSNEEGKTVELNKLKNKIVVLEWYNKDCPFVRKHYGSKNMQNLQKKWTEKGIVWLSIISSAEGKQGYLTQAEAILNKTTSGSSASHILLDAKGVVGQMYGAKTTPHMYVIDKSGKLIYQGAIDSNSSPDPSVIAISKNYVDQILTQVTLGKEVRMMKTPAYGCGVKY